METSITAENLAEDRGFVIRQGFLLYPREASEVDYKAGLPFVAGDQFALKLIKHILGMANAGGGYIVIGYPENASKQPEAAAVSDEIIASYDVSNIAACVEKYKTGTEKIDIKVHKERHPTSKQVYPILEIGGFKSRPFFCKSSAKGILVEHALYIRVAGARTIKVASPDEWDQLIDICVQRHQDELLRRFSELAREIGLFSSINNNQLENPKKNLEKWIEEVRIDAKIEAGKAGVKFEGFEIIHSVNIEKKWSVTELLDAMQASVQKNTGWPIGNVFLVPEYKPKPHKKGLRSMVASDGFDYWFLNTDGSFYFFRSFQEDSRRFNNLKNSSNSVSGRELWFDTQIWRVCEGLEHTVSLCKSLKIDGASKVRVMFNFLGIQDRSLGASPGTGRHLFPTTSGSVSEFEWEQETSLDTLAVSVDQNTIQIVDGLFEKFDFQKLMPAVIRGVIQEYRGNTVRR